MLDIGWTELLVIAIVLIVVVGPKDLPPMLRAFGKMTKRLRVMAGEFRQQFDEALREAELDDVRQTFSDAQKLNPVNSLKEALNPLRQMGNDIRNDLQSAVRPEEQTIAEPWKPEPEVKLPGEAPTFPVAAPTTVTPAAAAETPASRDAPVAGGAQAAGVAASATQSAASAEAGKPARKPRSPKPAAAEAASAGDETKPPPRRKPTAVSKPAASTTDTTSNASQKPAARKAATKTAKAEPGATRSAAKAATPKKPAAKAKKTGDA